MTEFFLPRRRALIAGGAGLLAAPAIVRGAFGQGAYPSKPVRLIVAFAPGGTTDLLARLVANHLQATMGQQFVVENRTGAGGNIGADIVAKAAPDGYTLLFGTVGSAVTNQFLYKSMPHDSKTAFAPVALVGEVANVLAVHPDVPARSVKEFIELAKAKGGQLNYGSPAVGGTGHLAMELFKVETGIKVEHIVYKGSSLVIQDLLPGRVQCTIDNLPPYLPHIRSGALRALAVTSSKRWFSLPDTPTIAESGVPGYEAAPWWYVAAPAGTPADIVKKLSDEIVRGVKSADMDKRIRDAGAAPLPGTHEELARHIASETVKWKKVVDAAGLKPE
ncbi:MAG: tripartite tricarboxylate transporter substrate binding protein [Rhodospirillales bacterium]|nr:MAG: tripartite tricarboxylate transporter substrate binding protein [Rhodospirillales bacterium]